MSASGLSHPGVAGFAAGRFCSALATNITATALGWQLYERTGSRFALGLVGLVEVIPVLMLAVPAGVLADRTSRKGLAVLSHLALAAACVGHGWVTWANADVSGYFVFLALAGAAMAFRAASVGPLVPLLVPPHDFANVNAWMSSTYELAAMAGPAAAGLLLAHFGIATHAFAIAAVAHLIFVGALLVLPKLRQPAPSPDRLGWKNLFAGLRFILRTKPFFAAITLDMFAVLLAGATALFPVFAKDVLHAGPNGLAVLRAAPALGAFLMALLQTRLPAWKRPGLAMLWTVVGFGIATVGFAVSTHLWVSATFLFLSGVFDNISVVIRSTLEQSLTPDAMRGRVSAMHSVFISISNELGTFESGLAAAWLGPVPAVALGGIGCLLVVALVAWRYPALRQLSPLHTLRPEPTYP